MNEDFDELKTRAKKIAEGATESVKDTLGNIQDSPEWEEFRRVATGLAKEAAEVVKKYPLQSVAGAAAIGFVLSSFLNRRR